MILLSLAPTPRWQRLEGGRVVASGEGWPPPAPGAALIMAVPGEAVALHWLDLPALAPAQAAAAARLALAERLGEADPHIAVAPGEGLRPVAVVARAAMAGWAAEAARAGWTAQAMLPDPLLLAAPASGWAVHEADGRTLARAADAGFAAEAALAAVLLGDAPRQAVQPALPDPLPLNLLVGDFAPAPVWRVDGRQLRRLALLAAAITGLWLGGDVAALIAARRAASASDAAVLALAPAGSADAAAALAALKAQAQQRGAGGGLAAVAGPVVTALAARPGAGLATLAYTPAGGLVAGVAGGSGEAQALADAVAGSGLVASPGQTRATADGSITDVTVRAP